MTCASLREGALYGLVDVGAAYRFERDGLVALVHHGQILDVLESLDRDAGLHPARPPVGEVVPPCGILVDGVEGIGEMGLDDLPCPCPGEIGEITLLLRVLVAVDRIERCENVVFLHDVEC